MKVIQTIGVQTIGVLAIIVLICAQWLREAVMHMVDMDWRA